MTAQPRIALDDLTSDALDALYDRAEKTERAVDLLAEQYRRLEADNARLTAGQCLDSRAMCEQHHAPPVAGCPYPRCRAARPLGAQPPPDPTNEKETRMIRPLTVRLTPETSRLLRLYRGQSPATVLARAVRLLATADGHLDAAGNVKPRRP
ncbi:hypothetical protein [Streptomyces anulatus]|uniref:hypothetical protein n=1 Tax=Streptomyces anulatus TaxID=1892 RepID=UPI003F49B9C1